MKPRYKMAGGMFLLVLFIGSISVGVLRFVGSGLAILTLGVTVPLLVIVGAVWVQKTVTASGASRTEFERRKAREVGEHFKEVWSTLQQIHDEYPFGVTDADLVQSHIQDIEDAGITVDKQTGAFEIHSGQSLGSVEEFNRLQKATDELKTEIKARFAASARSRISEVNTTLSKLEPLVHDSTTVSSNDVPKPGGTQSSLSWRDIAGEIDQCYREADQVIEEACEKVQSASASTGKKETSSLVLSARKAADVNDYKKAVSDILSARDDVEIDAKEQFEQQKEELNRLVSTVSTTAVDDYVGDNHLDAIDEYSEELYEFDEAIEIADMRHLREQIEESCIEIVSDLENQIEQALETLENTDVPEGWYDDPEGMETDYVQNLKNTSEIEHFRSEWVTSVDILLNAVDQVGTKSDVVKGYDRIEEQIETTLRSSGQVEPEDIPVNESQEQFLGLYYRKHMDEVKFDPGVPKLFTTAGGETHTVTVTASFPTGGQERELTVKLASDSFSQTETVRTPLAADVTFEDVSYGKYDVEVEPAGDEFSSATTTVTVDSDTSMDIALQSISLKERVCEGVDVNIDDALSQITSRFETRFEDEGHLSSEMSFPIDEEYVSCLLVSWAAENGHEAMMGSKGVIIFDSTQLRKEIENVIQYNLDSGDTKSYDELQNNFLSAPVSDEVVRDLLEESAEKDKVMIDETGLTKKEGS